ncbi:ATP-binding cassette sub-family F member 3 [Dermatophagoides pteronyssinus]|uniref:ATP-binding cassette sub-family F member 3-like n=1 Tax=Dermatophagoides pteronyssinus TaxID=6956 RepID=A0A6P6YFZ1_DERPT|nr:ATP-binding cassette sub-family F member 3-like [Dermatophagoides pteronyssinus]
MAATEIINIVQAQIPDIDQQLSDYITGVLTSDTFASAKDIKEAVGEIFISCFNDAFNPNPPKSPESLCQTMCDKIFNIIRANNELDDDDDDDIRLSRPIHIGSTVDDEKEEEWKSIWTSGKEVESKVDQNKLRKAEEKLKQKAERRDGVGPTTTENTTISNVQASASQSLSKKSNRQEESGTNRTKDIKIENFDISFGSHVLLQGANLSLNYGERYGLCGRNGIGKSTLLKMLSTAQLVIPSHIRILHVEQEVVGDDTTALDSVLECDTVRKDLLEREKILSQKSSLTDKETEQLNEIYHELTAIEADKAPAKAATILLGLGFTHEMQKNATKTFSGGWRMRLALARALFSKPDLLLLDEPTNMLDMKAIIWLTNYLINHWTSTLLVVSHDRKFLSEVPTQILHFHSRKIDCYQGTYESFMTAMTEKLKNQEREFESQQMYIKHTQEFIDRFRYNSKRASLVQSRIKTLDKLKIVDQVEKESIVVFKLPQPESLSPPILELTEVNFAYQPGSTILKNINLNANLQSRICIVGDNGSGKTTLLKLLIGDLNPTSGVRHSHRNLAIGYFTQHHVDQLPMNQSPLQFMATQQPGKSAEHYRKYLGGFGITGDLGLQSLQSLSGGQKSRVAFAAMTLTNPHLLIMDEPTNHLDVETVEALAKALNDFSGGVILVTHDQNMIQKVCQELWHCTDGTIKCLKGGFEEYKAIIYKELQELA